MPALSDIGRSLTTAVLEERYVRQRQTTRQIADALHTSVDVVLGALKRCDIARRHGAAAYTRFGYTGRPGYKNCPTCRRELRYREFHKSSRGPHGRVSMCRRCSSQRMKKYAHGARDSRRLRKAVLVMEFGNRCAKCGLDNLPMDLYTFHHHSQPMRDAAYLPPSVVVSSKNAALTATEKQKWTMLCANCHALAHSCGLTAVMLLHEHAMSHSN